MKAFNFEWIVEIGVGEWMVGVHRFKTKKKAQAFIDEWNTVRNKATIKCSNPPKLRRMKREAE